MKMKYNIEVDQDRGQFIVHAQGHIDTEAEKCMFDEIIAHPMWSAQFNLLFDHSHCHWGHLSSDDIVYRAKLIGQLSRHFNDRKMAIVLSTDLDYGLGRMLEAFTYKNLNGTLHIFRSVNEAETWLS